MGIFNFFVGKKETGAVASSEGSKAKYERAFINFERCYNDNWSAVGASRGKRENNITMLKGGIDLFSHKENHKEIYDTTYKPVVSNVLNFSYLLRIHDALRVMDDSLRNPSNTTLKRFDTKKKDIHPMIENEEKLGRLMAQFLMYGDMFKKSIDTRLSKDAAGIFPLYVSLTIAEKEYYNSLCQARDNTLPTGQVHSSKAP